MNIKDISITKSMTVNLGNYSSHRVEFGMTATLDDDEDVDQSTKKLTALVDQKLASEVARVLNDQKSRQTLMEQDQ
jgi:hypothetical protein